jgi:malonyl CoA-acyl carrier protein transacylase
MPSPEPFVVMFPGQGSQEASMRETVAQHRPDLLEPATAAVGEDPFAAVGRGTRFDQPAIYCASLAGFERLGRPQASFYAGHSLGEIPALVAAGSLSEEDGLRLVVERGRVMQEVAEALGGGMLALRTDHAGAAAIAERCGLAVANANAPTQTVLSGPEAALERAQQEARAEGLLAKRLPVVGPFHSPIMEPAVKALRAVLDSVEVRTPRVPVFSCVTAAPFDDVRARLAEALVRPVRWLEVMQSLHAAGVRRFLETGPGKVLAGLVRRSLAGIETLTQLDQEPARA